jgi:hypothetical protein
MSKINVLVAPGDRAGSGKFRCVDPHIALEKNFGDDYHVEINYEIDFNDTDYLKNFQIIFIHRLPQGQQLESAVPLIRYLKSIGIKVVVDTDDHWSLDPSHGYYIEAQRVKLASFLIQCLDNADLVTVPTPILASEVLKAVKHKNV